MTKKLINTLTYEINGLALFEDRRFVKAPGERYLFINNDFINNNFNKILKKDDFALKPSSLEAELGSDYFEIFELEAHLTKGEYNNLLIELLKKISSYDQMNILIIPLLKHKNYNKELINYLIEESLNNIIIRRSFEVQKHLLTIIVENKKLIDATLFHRVLSDFPHQSGEGWVETSKLK